MNIEVKMPDLSTTGSAMTLVRWLVPPGQAVQRGQMILEVETDKAAVEVECTATGVLREIRFHEGDPVNVGDVIAVIEAAETGANATAGAAARSASSPVSPPPASVVLTSGASAPARQAGGLFARNRAAAAAAASSPPAQTIPLSAARRTAALRLQQSKQTIPHFYLQTSANAAAMVARRSAALPEKLAWDAFFVHAAARVLPRFPELTCRFENESLVPANTTIIGVAADIGGDLFVIPVERPAEKPIEELSAEIRAAAEALRRGEPGSRRNQPGLLTITNLGGSNVETFTAIINPPEAAILAIGKVRPVVVPGADGGFAVEQRVNLTLSVDHRIVSGNYAADFLSALVETLENL